jgi:hypothetical protein
MKYHQSRQLYLIEVLPDHSSVNMPTATEYFGISVTNIGPLTTTYTPPPACTRATTDHLVYALESSLIYGFGSPDCEIDPYGKCLPSGAAVDSFIKEYSHPKSGQGIHPFHSPGIHCPEGWTTAGLLAHGDKTGSAFRSGVFTTTATVNSSQPLQMGSDEWWLKVLEPSETLAWCCPRYVALLYSLFYCTLTPSLAAAGTLSPTDIADPPLPLLFQPATTALVMRDFPRAPLSLSIPSRVNVFLIQTGLSLSFPL